jgi:peptidoglycan-associated lipoprotein
MTPHFRRTLVGLAAAAALMVSTGCHKKTVAAAPPPPPPTGDAPTATLTASPSAVAPGQQVSLTWRTNNATDVSIDGIGPVETAGIKSVTPTASTDYHLVARGPGGSTDATARVTVTAASSMTDTNTGSDSSAVDDAMFHTNVQDIFFDYDAYDVRPDEQSIISKDVAFLAAHPGLKIVIGGYCDDRGSTEYNLALGENRANAVKQAMVAAGVNAERVRTVSYGKEKQFCTEETESCWQQNRRAGFSVDR